MLKSGITLRDRVYVPDYDSHDQMLRELKVRDTGPVSSEFVRWELTPPQGDVFQPVDTWKYQVDQDILPDWYVEEVDRVRAVDAVKKWAKEHIFEGVSGLHLSSGAGYHIRDCTGVVLDGDARVNQICGDAQVYRIFDGARVNRIYGNARVNEIFDDAQVNEIYGNAWVNEIYGNAQVNEISGNAQVNLIYGSAQVDWISGGAQVNLIYGSAQVNRISGIAQVIVAHASELDMASVSVLDNAIVLDFRTHTIYHASGWTARKCGGV